MRELIEFLRQNPLVVFIVLAWLAGMVGNVVKSVRTARQRAEQQRRMPTAEPRAAQRTATETDVAAEMRRILGMDPETPPRAAPSPPPLPQPAPRRLVEVERPPTPVLPTTQQRRLQIHVDPHVGDGIKKREQLARREPTPSVGALGGRTAPRHRARLTTERYPRTNLRQALVLSEILGPPLALRPQEPDRLR